MVEKTEFVNTYCILTSDSTYDILPKENGTLGKHQNKVSKQSKLIGNAGMLAGAAGIVGMGTAGYSFGLHAGARTATTAIGVSDVADAVNGLAET